MALCFCKIHFGVQGKGMKTILFLLSVIISVVFNLDSAQASELPRHTQEPHRYAQNVRNFVLSICHKETPRVMYWKEVGRQIIFPTIDLSPFILRDHALEEWKRNNITDQYINGLSLDVLTTYEIVVKNKGLTTDMAILLKSESYSNALIECFGNNENKKNLFTATLIYADMNSATRSLGAGYISNYLAIKWIGLAISKLGTIAQAGLKSKLGQYLVGKMNRVGHYIQQHGVKAVMATGLVYGYGSSAYSGYTNMENRLTHEQIRINEHKEKWNLAQKQKNDLKTVISSTEQEMQVYLNSTNAQQNVIKDFEQDIRAFQVSLETLREEQRQHQLQICKIVYTQENDVARCYATNIAHID